MKRKVSLISLNNLTSNTAGLNDDQVLEQRAKFGVNNIVERSENPWLGIFTDTIKDPMVWFLVGIAILFFITGDTQEAIVLFLASIPLIFMDAFLHWRTQSSTTVLKGQLSSSAQVIRNGRTLEIDSFDIVPGDLISLSPENQFLPADGFWQESQNLQVDESVLTGESFPVSKSAIDFDPFSKSGDVLMETTSLGFAGTRVLTGKGLLRVLSTGPSTSYGEIVQSVTQSRHQKTPLQLAILDLTRLLIYGALVFCGLLAIIRYYQGYGWLDALMSAAVLAVAAIPEEFPVVFSFFLGVGVYRLAKHHALVRRAVSVENIGRVTQICTDKTGTLTIGKLKLTHLKSSLTISEDELLTNACVACDANGVDPVDAAIIDAAHRKNLVGPARFAVIPFTEGRKRETAFVHHNESIFCVMKGAPEVIMSKSQLSNEELDSWNRIISQWAREGHKVLAVASLTLPHHFTNTGKEPSEVFEFNGLLAFEDPARPEVKGAIQYCRQNSIKVLMITGDHPETALAIAKDIGLSEHSPRVISTEQEPEKLTEEWIKQHPDFFKKVDVVARCNPIQKLQIVEALKASGELVVVTGDGVNDVPALKAADIGVSMGLRGTRSAKEVSAIILSDDNFNTIVNAIREGKQLFENLRMSFKYLLLFHIPFVLSAAIIPLMGYPLLYLPIHVVWLELIIHPTALFAFQLHQAGIKKGKPSNHNFFFNNKDKWLIFALGLTLTVVVLILYVTGITENQKIEHGRAQVMALLSFWSAGLVAVLTKGEAIISKLTIGATIATSLFLIQSGWFSLALHLTPLHSMDWIKIVLIISIPLMVLKLSDQKEVI